MRMILFVIIVASFILYPWVGKAYSWILTPLVENSFGAVFVGCCLIFSVIGIFNLFMGKTRIDSSGMPKFKKKNKQQ